MIVIYLVFVLGVIALAMGAMELVFKHQRELAAIRRNSSDNQIAALEQKIDDLTQLVYQQTIALDGAPRLSADERLTERIGA